MEKCLLLVCILGTFVDSADVESAFRTKSVSTSPHLHRTCVSEPLCSSGLFRLSGVMSQYLLPFRIRVTEQVDVRQSYNEVSVPDFQLHHFIMKSAMCLMTK
jgi:hypothetical protein